MLHFNHQPSMLDTEHYPAIFPALSLQTSLVSHVPAIGYACVENLK
jgi:hypothetical protein